MRLAGNADKAARDQLTLIRIFEKLRRRGYGGGYDAVRRYARRWQTAHGQSSAAAYVPLTFAPGEAYQFDWSHEIVLLSGVTVRVKVAVAKLAPNGSLPWNTFLGGGKRYVAHGIAVDVIGNVYVTGRSGATWGSPVRAYTASQDDSEADNAWDAFAAKLTPAGGLTWSTFLGGGRGDAGYAIAVDSSGNVDVVGWSDAPWDRPLRAYTAQWDAFVAKLTSAGALTWNTFLGGSGMDRAAAIAVDGSGNVYVSGETDNTWSSPIRTQALQGDDAFAAKLTPAGALTWNTFFGASGSDSATAIAVDGSGNIYVAGASEATWGNPTRAYTASRGDAFTAELTSSGALTRNAFLGGGGLDFGRGIAVDGRGTLCVTGGSDFAWGNPVRAYTAFKDAFVVRMDTR